jgi:hypothetical protein
MGKRKCKLREYIRHTTRVLSVNTQHILKLLYELTIMPYVAMKRAFRVAKEHLESSRAPDLSSLSCGFNFL